MAVLGQCLAGCAGGLAGGAMGLINALGNLGGFVGSSVPDEDASGGDFLSTAVSAVALVLGGLVMLTLRRQTDKPPVPEPEAAAAAPRPRTAASQRPEAPAGRCRVGENSAVGRQVAGHAGSPSARQRSHAGVRSGLACVTTWYGSRLTQ